MCVELYEEHEVINLYSILFSDENEPLIDQFLNGYSKPEFEDDLHAISYWLDKIGKRGALERHFKPEGHPQVKAIPVPPPSSKLRLYCFRINDEILIFGGGKIKEVRTFQEDPELLKHVQIVKKTGKKIQRYLDQGKIMKNGKELTGKLTFEIEI